MDEVLRWWQENKGEKAEGGVMVVEEYGGREVAGAAYKSYARCTDDETWKDTTVEKRRACVS